MTTRLILVLVEEDPPQPPFFDERDLAVIAMYEDDTRAD
jgi:hypothetical protein